MNSVWKWFAILFVEILLAMLGIISPGFAIMAVVAGAAVLISLAKPEYVLYTMVFLIVPGPLLGIKVGGVVLEPPHLFVVAVLLSWLIVRSIDTRPPSDGTGCDQPLLLFLAWAALSLLWSHDRVVGLEDTLKLFAAISLVFLITAYVRDSRTLSIVLTLFIITALIAGILSVVYPYIPFYKLARWELHEHVQVAFKFWFKHRTVGPAGRGMGFLPAHGTAVILSFAITFCMMFFIVNKNKKTRTILTMLALFLVAAIICTMTKSIVVSLLISATYVVLHLKPLRQHLIKILVAFCVLIVVSFVLTRIQNIGRAAYILGEGLKPSESSELKETSLGVRMEMSKIGLQKLWDTGGLGTGIGGFLQYTRFDNMDGSHPAILWDLGFVGIGVWIWLFVSAYKLFTTAIRTSDNEYYRRMLIVYMGGYVNVIISWFVTFSYADMYLWFYLAIGFVLVHLAKQQTPESDKALPFTDKKGGTIVVF